MDSGLWKLLALRSGISEQTLVSSALHPKKLIEIKVVETKTFVGLFLTSFKNSEYPKVLQLNDENLQTAGKEVLVAEEKKDLNRLKDALVQFYNKGSQARIESINVLCQSYVNSVLVRHCHEDGELNTLQMLLKSGIRFRADIALMNFARHGNMNSVQLLLDTPDLDYHSGSNYDPFFGVNMAITQAASKGIKKLIQRTFANFINNNRSL